MLNFLLACKNCYKLFIGSWIEFYKVQSLIWMWDDGSEILCINYVETYLEDL